MPVAAPAIDRAFLVIRHGDGTTSVTTGDVLEWSVNGLRFSVQLYANGGTEQAGILRQKQVASVQRWVRRRLDRWMGAIHL